MRVGAALRVVAVIARLRGMSSAKGKILRLLSGVSLRRATVVTAEDVGGFRRLGDTQATAVKIVVT